MATRSSIEKSAWWLPGPPSVWMLHGSATVLGSRMSGRLRDSRHLDSRLAVGCEALLYGSSTGMALPGLPVRRSAAPGTVGAAFGLVRHPQGSQGSGRHDVLRADADLEAVEDLHRLRVDDIDVIARCAPPRGPGHRRAGHPSRCRRRRPPRRPGRGRSLPWSRRVPWSRRAAAAPRRPATPQVDADTGFVKLLKHWAVEDCGRVINPMLVDKRMRGAIVQGIGGALFEECL